MVRESRKEDLKEILELYLHLHEESIPEQSVLIADMGADHAGFNSTDKTAFIQWLPLRQNLFHDKRD